LVNTIAASFPATQSKKPSQGGLFAEQNLERDKRLELSTYTLARYRSTN
jgi:hypothetical protein